ncbi:liver-expressed antimicrobial peptide 2 [Gadus morhua]|uniref:liver-expressed antimicrobial peptide 2 n=1 Tax=Gadus morhua TaxID=8049 RepID=UPI0011B82577|nr:liver-expressed antimicrobial peptide 2-like [Gadus morhua]XP_056444623.1 liver-expressed antimicrobial peptide 2-like [Gadus chalcogrammus]XP_059906269.1 liver-expressed antimicrobial peptide 2-like [Gadus macrocephalus]
MQALVFKITVVFLLLSVVPDFQVQGLPLPTELDGLLQRTRRSLLWRWNTLKPVGGSCRAHTECGTNYCSRNNICTFWFNSP